MILLVPYGQLWDLQYYWHLRCLRQDRLQDQYYTHIRISLCGDCTNWERKIDGILYFSTEGSDQGKIESDVQSDKKTVDMFFCGGAHWSSVFLFAQKDWKRKHGCYGDDGYYDAPVLFSHV